LLAALSETVAFRVVVPVSGCITLLFVIYTDGNGTFAAGGAATPVPVKLTCCNCPVGSLLLIIQVSEIVPVFVGWKRTVSVTDFPAAIVVPSANVVEAVKPTPDAGGFDLVIVRSTPPGLATVKVATAVPPIETLPRSVFNGEICSFGGCPPLPDSRTSAGPAEVFNVRLSVNAPTVVGVNVIVTVTLALDAIVEPFAGTPLTENGVAGDVRLLTVSGCAPVLLNVTVEDVEPPPIATPPKLIVGYDDPTRAVARYTSHGCSPANRYTSC